MADFHDSTLTQLAAGLRARKFSSVELTEAFLGRIERHQAALNAFISVTREEALQAARAADQALAKNTTGALLGVPIAHKDLFCTRGVRTTCGSHMLENFVSPYDATVVAKLRTAGAIILGHSNMPDFANSDTTRSSSFGRTGNAYDVRFSPGGSSGGTVTAVSGNMAVLGNGTDTGNSIRMPSGTSALIGVFPTRGLVSIAGIAPLDWLLDDTGPIARNVMDAAIALVRPGTTTGDIVSLWPKATEFGFPDETAAFALQYGHGVGLSIWEKPIFSRLVSLEHPEVLAEGMVFALETYWPAADGWSAARIEEELVVTADGCEVITNFPAEDLLVAGRRYWTAGGALRTVRESQSHLNTAAGRGEPAPDPG